MQDIKNYNNVFNLKNAFILFNYKKKIIILIYY